MFRKEEPLDGSRRNDIFLGDLIIFFSTQNVTEKYFFIILIAKETPLCSW